MKTQTLIGNLLCKLGGDKEMGTAEALSGVYAQAHARDFESASDKWILFSDHHRGAKNGADDFSPCEKTYCDALTYYFERGYSLCLMGDVEELWEERPWRVLNKKNDLSFAAERQFHEAGRCTRLWGNHDEIWSEAKQVLNLLQPHYGDKPLEIYEAIKLNVRNGGQKLGEILLVHGHQGTQNAIDLTNRTKSEKAIQFSKFILRTFWRPLQQFAGFSCNTPAQTWGLRAERDKIIHEWASARDRLVLIAGHTHTPVFTSRTHSQRVLKDIDQTQEALSNLTADQQAERDQAHRQIVELTAKLQELEQKMTVPELEAWNREKELWKLKKLTPPKPSYFNTGCCCFADSKITGIEIADGEMRLVRFPDDEGKPFPKILQDKRLDEIFGNLEL